MSSESFIEQMPQVPSVAGFLDALKYDRDGLVTVVVQDSESNEVLMLAFADRKAVEKTLETGLMHYYSRSRKKMWLKGEESGNVQKVVTLAVDCDGDAVLAKVEQKSGACHLGYRSCFAYQIGKDGGATVIGDKLFDPATVYKKS